MSNCRTGCPTQDHESYSQCLQESNLQMSTGDAGRPSSQKKWDAELNAYQSARKQGIQPAGTTLKKIQEAVELSNKVGKAFDAGTNDFKG